VGRRTTSAQPPKVETDNLLHISIRMYKDRMRYWGFSKNIRLDEIKFVIQKQQARRIKEPDKPDFKFRVGGLVVAPESIDRFMRRHIILANRLYSPSSGAWK